MRHGTVAAAAALLLAAGVIAAAPPAGRLPVQRAVLSKCDGPVQPDGTWQRCVAVTRLIPNGASSYLVPDGHCEQLGPDQHPADLAFADPPGHID